MRPLETAEVIQARKDRGRILLASIFAAFVVLLMVAVNFLRGGTD